VSVEYIKVGFFFCEFCLFFSYAEGLLFQRITQLVGSLLVGCPQLLVDCIHTNFQKWRYFSPASLSDASCLATNDTV